MRGSWSVLVAAACGLVAPIASCGGDAGSAATSNSATAPTTGRSAEGIDVLYLTDSSGWRVAQEYVRVAEDELGVPVRLIDWRIPGLSMVEALARIEERPQVVAEAEVIVLWANPLHSGVKDEANACMSGTGAPPQITSVGDWKPFADLFGEALDAIWRARADAPTAIRVTDLYSPAFEQWKQAGVYEACRTAWTTMSDAIAAVAATHGATMVSAWDVYNGTQHDEDPVDKGWIASDGVHPSDAGAQAMAAALAAVGFEPSPAP